MERAMGAHDPALLDTVGTPQPAPARAKPNLGPETARALRYLMFGAMAAGVNFGSRFGWSLVLPFHFAVVVAYLTGSVFAFLTFRYFVFSGAGAGMVGQVRNFVIVNLLGITQTWILAMAMVDFVLPAIGWTFHPEACGHAVAVGAPAVTSWFGHRYFTFRAAKASA
jgi:putative flippase GtrA